MRARSAGAIGAAIAIAMLAGITAACGGDTSTSPSATGSPTMTGTWAGTASDSSSATGAGSMMGQAGMGSMTWPLTQTGSAVTGAMNFSGMVGRSPGTFLGTMSGNDMPFTMDLPDNSMMSAGCTARASGTAHVDGARMTMTGTYGGTNSCTGAFVNGQMTMTRQ